MNCLQLKPLVRMAGLCLLMAVTIACSLSFLRGDPAPRPEGEFSYDCSPRPDDLDGYLVAVCEYLNENQIWLGDFSTIEIAETRELIDEQGRPVVEVRLNCCGTGDIAGIDLESGDVVYYILGIY